jgi:hypothetical protein
MYFLINFASTRTGKVSARFKKAGHGEKKMIKHEKHWTRIERDVLLKFKKIHLQQQAHERNMLAQNILKALEDGRSMNSITMEIGFGVVS